MKDGNKVGVKAELMADALGALGVAAKVDEMAVEKDRRKAVAKAAWMAVDWGFSKAARSVVMKAARSVEMKVVTSGCG